MKKIVNIRRAGALGDVLLSTALLKKIKETYPDMDIWYSTECPRVLRNNPYLEKVVRMHEPVLAEKVFNLDLAYENNPNMNVVDAYSLVVFNALLEDKKPCMYSIPEDANMLKRQLPQLDFLGDKILVFHMTTSWKNRTWQTHKWDEVINKFAIQGYQIVVVGAGADQVATPAPNIHNAINLLYPHEIRELLKVAKCFIGMDSGMLHVAQTTDVPIVGLFTVANPKFRIVREEKTKSIYPKNLECTFCLHRENPPVTFKACHREKIECLDLITPIEVITEIEGMLA